MPRTGSPSLAAASRRLSLAAFAALALGATACESPEAKLAKYLDSGEQYLEIDKLGLANVQFLNALKLDDQNIRALEGLTAIAERKGDYQQMFGLLQKINRADPANLPARLNLAKLHLLANEADKSLEFVDKILAETPENAEALATKAAIMFRLQNNAEAVELANKALAINPLSEEATAVLASERVSEKDFDGALAILEAAIAKNPKTSVLQLLRVQVLGSLGRTEDINAAYTSLIKEIPDDANYRRMYATSLISQDKIEAAREQLVEVARLMPRQREAKLDVVRIDFRIGGRAKAEATLREFIKADAEDEGMKFALGAFLREQKDYAAAEKIYGEIITDKGSEVGRILEAKNEIAAIRMLEGKRPEAEALIGEILAADGKNPAALSKRAGFKIDDGKIDDAIGDLRIVLAEYPDDIGAHLLLGTAFERKGDMNVAGSEFAEAVERSRNAAQPSNVLARHLLRKGDIARAERVLVESIAIDSTSVENLKLLAAIRLENQNWRGAEEAAKALQEAGDADKDASRILGAAYAGLKDYAGAIDILAKEYDRAPLDARPLAMLVQAYIDAGRLEDATKFLEEAIARNPSHYEARILLSQVRRATNQADAAITLLNEAIKIDPLRSEAYEAMYGVLVVAGRRADAGTFIERAVSVLPDNDGLQILKADHLIATGDADGAIAIYDTILARRPNDPIISNNLASLLLDKNDPESDARALKAAQALKGAENPFMLDTYGWALYRGGKVAEGIEVLERAAAKAPNLIDVRYHLGVALLETGQAGRGAEELNFVANSKDASVEMATAARRLLSERQ